MITNLLHENCNFIIIGLCLILVLHNSALVGGRDFANNLTTKCFPKQLHYNSRSVVFASHL
ncbi:transmembrane protein, putative [Medicago truncatula]|uniref:Transmembrane protein, putative n=1 Tax=Medicago truncatula TaxID=3880 RepID=G7IY91_MEDTR|nr:transmembrane protein, putative [Medicago truncatula]